jgi:type VI protein secretion system component VasF
LASFGVAVTPDQQQEKAMDEDDKNTWHHITDWLIAAMFVAVLTALLLGYLEA